MEPRVSASAASSIRKSRCPDFESSSICLSYRSQSSSLSHSRSRANSSSGRTRMAFWISEMLGIVASPAPTLMCSLSYRSIAGSDQRGRRAAGCVMPAKFDARALFTSLEAAYHWRWIQASSRISRRETLEGPSRSESGKWDEVYSPQTPFREGVSEFARPQFPSYTRSAAGISSCSARSQRAD